VREERLEQEELWVLTGLWVQEDFQDRQGLLDHQEKTGTKGTLDLLEKKD